MNSKSIQEALAVLDDATRPAMEREQAAHKLAAAPAPESVERLVAALEDEESGVRWAAAAALIDCGETALAPLLNALVSQPDSTWLREGAHHVFSNTRSLKVQQATADVVKALKGPASGVATTEAAVRALMALQG
ncbi:MAG: HEAT repeat domain-containing protein [Caldilinea sp.]|nr:HEAT repeat domain-containing protein [Caldilinea sp.]